MRFTKDHEWVRLEGDVATVGISKHAAEALGDVVFVETPEAGKAVSKGDSFAVVECVKAASDVYAPVAGVVVVGNAALASAPETVNAVLRRRQSLHGVFDHFLNLCGFNGFSVSADNPA